MLAESVRITEAPAWDAAKLEAIEGRMLAESVRITEAPSWDAADSSTVEPAGRAQVPPGGRADLERAPAGLCTGSDSPP